ncbi:hypothetical protein AS361_05705 [Myroides marinus]|uniref:oligosaccharide flippase family protein n=1 Tax=Myroides marinus TaxID=703342 RepID=UPI0007422F6B|nr:oligosaccharide flippase family protein [Myroides marinus]KUF42858.1 hypothetical protein AS361_05705 [Myroides marinus]
MSSYKTILKTTGLFAGLRVLSILVNVGISKLIAIFIGVSGIGLYGVFTNALTLLSTVSDLGISKSSVRNIANTEAKGDAYKLNQDISIISKLIYYTGIIGCVVTIVLSYYLSKISFGNSDYTISFVFLGLAVLFTVIKEGQSSVFQGLRRYRLMAKNTIIISFLSFIVSIPILWFYKENGIILSILATAFIGALVTKISLHSVTKKIDNVRLTYENSSDLIKLGLSMMLIALFISLSGYILRSYIGVVSSIETVGYFQAGFQIISGYFGLIFTAMASDYFPRISALSNKNKELEREVNQQALLSLILIGPLVVLLPFVMPYMITILYSSDFKLTIVYVCVALFGVIFQCGSQTMGMILLAKNNAKVFVSYVVTLQTIFLINNILLFNSFGILGLAVGFSINMLLDLISINLIVNKLYKIKFNTDFFKYLLIVFLFALVSYGCSRYFLTYKFMYCLLLLSLNLIFTFLTLRKLLKIQTFKVKDVIKYFKKDKSY